MARPLPRSNHCRTGIWRLTEILEPSSLSVYTLIRWPLRRPRHCKTLGILTVNLYYVTALSPDNEDIKSYVIAEDEDSALLHWSDKFFFGDGVETVNDLRSVFDDTIEVELLRAAPGEAVGLIRDRLIEQICRAAIISTKF